MKREVFVLRISSGNVNASGFVTCQYLKNLLKKSFGKSSLFVFTVV